VDNGDVATLNLEDNNISDSNGFVLVIAQDEKVTTKKGRLHATTGKENQGRRNTGQQKDELFKYKSR